jgi:hypothetical protein
MIAPTTSADSWRATITAPPNEIPTKMPSRVAGSLGKLCNRLGTLTMKVCAEGAPIPPSPFMGEGRGEGTIRGEATFHRPGWLDSPHDR